MRKASDQLMERPQLKRDVFPRGDPEATVIIPSDRVEASLYELMSAYVVQRRRESQRQYNPGQRVEAFALEEAREWLREIMPRLAGWTPVLFIVAIGLKLLSLRGLIEAFVLPGPRIPDITGNLTLEVLGSVVMAVALLATVALLVPAAGHARGRRPVRAAGWAVAFAGGVALVWALAELNLLFSPMLI